MAVSRKTAAVRTTCRTTASREFADHWDLSDLVTDPVKQFDRYLKDLSAKSRDSNFGPRNSPPRCRNRRC